MVRQPLGQRLGAQSGTLLLAATSPPCQIHGTKRRMVGKGLHVLQLAKADGTCFPDMSGRHIGVAQPPHHPGPKPLYLTLSF